MVHVSRLETGDMQTGVFLDGGKSVPNKHPPFAKWFLDPCKYNGGISLQDGFIDGKIER
jgi:hypothetical protein